MTPLAWLLVVCSWLFSLAAAWASQRNARRAVKAHADHAAGLFARNLDLTDANLALTIDRDHLVSEVARLAALNDPREHVSKDCYDKIEEKYDVLRQERIILEADLRHARTLLEQWRARDAARDHEQAAQHGGSAV